MSPNMRSFWAALVFTLAWLIGCATLDGRDEAQQTSAAADSIE